LAAVACEPHALASGTATRFDDDRIADVSGDCTDIIARANHARARVRDAASREPLRQPLFVGRAADRARARAEEWLARALDARGQPLEAATGLGCDQPDGVDRRQQILRERRPSWIDRDDVHAPGRGEPEATIGR